MESGMSRSKDSGYSISGQFRNSSTNSLRMVFPMWSTPPSPISSRAIWREPAGTSEVVFMASASLSDLWWTQKSVPSPMLCRTVRVQTPMPTGRESQSVRRSRGTTGPVRPVPPGRRTTSS